MNWKRVLTSRCHARPMFLAPAAGRQVKPTTIATPPSPKNGLSREIPQSGQNAPVFTDDVSTKTSPTTR